MRRASTRVTAGGLRPGNGPRAALLAMFLATLPWALLAGCAATTGAGEGAGAGTGAGAPTGASAGADADADVDAAADEDGLAVHGSLSARLRAQASGSEHDRDLFSLLDLQVGDEERDPWTGALVARLAKDLDGRQGASGSPFLSPDDTMQDSLTSRVYELHADAHDLPGLETLRLGRQTLQETPEFVRFDGASAETRPEGGSQRTWGLYAGRTVHFFESSSQGDSVWGAWLAARPWTGGSARLDWMHLEDETITASHDDDLLAVRLAQALPPGVSLQGDASWLSGEQRDYGVRATWQDGDGETLVQASFYELLERQNALVEELDPFSSVLFGLFPYRQARLLASRSFGEAFDLAGGLDLRRVSDSGDVTDFNRDFDHGFVTATCHHVVFDGTSVSVTGDTWDGGGETDIDTWGADVTHEWSPDVKASVGSSYALYKNDFFLGEERDHVRTWYATLRCRTAAQVTWSLGYELERGNVEDFHTITLRSTWRF